MRFGFCIDNDTNYVGFRSFVKKKRFLSQQNVNKTSVTPRVLSIKQ